MNNNRNYNNINEEKENNFTMLRKNDIIKTKDSFLNNTVWKDTQNILNRTKEIGKEKTRKTRGKTRGRFYCPFISRQENRPLVSPIVHLFQDRRTVPLSPPLSPLSIYFKTGEPSPCLPVHRDYNDVMPTDTVCPGDTLYEMIKRMY